MRATLMYGPGDVRVEERDELQIVEATDAIIRVSAACVCDSDLWPYRGIEDLEWPAPMGHEYAGIVEEVGSEVATIKPGQFVVGSFWASDNTSEICRTGYQSACVNRVPMGALGAQAELLRVPLADATLVATPDPADDLIPSLLSASDVIGTGWFGAVAAKAGPGKTVAVVGDGAVGLPCAGAPLPGRPDRPDLQPPDRPGQSRRPSSCRSHRPSRATTRWITARDQGAPAPVTPHNNANQRKDTHHDD